MVDDGIYDRAAVVDMADESIEVTEHDDILDEVTKGTAGDGHDRHGTIRQLTRC